MYDYAGQPWKTQAKVREVLSRLYVGSEIGQGYPGDEDNGEMSAWYVFSALGFYPLQVGSPTTRSARRCSPRRRSTWRTARSSSSTRRRTAPRTSTCRAEGQRAAIDQPFLPHDVLAHGGRLEFDMGPNPSRWATRPGAAPPSITEGSEVAQPLRDQTGAGAGTATAAAGDPAALFDDDSRTIAGPAPAVRYSFTARRDRRASTR